ncbi:MAG: hypothetical protein COB49_00555 [Alphaproteobacteria bacterium]|nr:MAG: hypothetical protein COB49_00555 [Alphaproteobacteria bacterium]
MKKDISMAALLQWTYGAQKAHLVVDQGRGLLPDERRADGRVVQAVSGCGVARCMDNAILGVEIDYYGPDHGSLDTDAEEVHDLVRSAVDIRMFDYVQTGQIIHYGQTGVLPNWMPGAVPKLGPVLDRRGRPKMLYADMRNSKRPYLCELKLIISPQQIEIAREIYSKFVNAVDRLKKYYQANPLKLNGYQVVSLGIQHDPWKKNIDDGGEN